MPRLGHPLKSTAYVGIDAFVPASLDGIVEAFPTRAMPDRLAIVTTRS